MSVLRWSFKIKVDKTICSSDHGQMILVSFSLSPVVSCVCVIPETLPCLHDKVIAVATDVIASLSLNQKQVGVPGILGGIIKGLKADKAEQDMEPAPNHDKYCENLESLFSSPPSLKPSKAGEDDRDVIELRIDDVVIDGLVIFDGPAPSSSIQKNKTEKKGAAAACMRYKLAKRQEKLESVVYFCFRYYTIRDSSADEHGLFCTYQKLSQNSKELRSGAEDFASMAKELAKRLETRKWWQGTPVERSTMHILITYLLTSY
ncbi:hypothetical protein DVH24_024349 [Malus domestica]|uniref:Uncharacterized protein n=1 Tax=Malus domestica TaxID=3750 RepID=A0A498JI92_MALDO|nr:hypothetical protein DVH24_024349 [Malus domestica]